MRPFSIFSGIVAPLGRDNIDTDAIIPKQFMKSIRSSGYGDNLFDGWRYLDEGEPGQGCDTRPQNPDFVLNKPRYRHAEILLVGENFGSGSSREHAVWALRDFGFRAIVAPSFADIFYRNCLKNGLLPAALSADTVQRLFAAVESVPEYRLVADLERQVVVEPDGTEHEFLITADRKHRLLHGLDDVGVTLARREVIKAYEADRRKLEPWLFLRHADGEAPGEDTETARSP